MKFGENINIQSITGGNAASNSFKGKWIKLDPGKWHKNKIRGGYYCHSAAPMFFKVPYAMIS